ncbi:hypothetical protein BHM03_00040743 [Ensete ventricosum]|nr:hypothetical protein BHM03_00040743 [Ensete ventricosum]
MPYVVLAARRAPAAEGCRPCPPYLVNSGTSPGDSAEKVNSGTNPGDLAEKVNSGTNPGDLAEKVNSGTSLGDLVERVNSGTNPGDSAEKVNSGTNPGDLAKKVNLGMSLEDLAERVNSGTNPGDLAERVNSGTNPGDLAEKVNLGVNHKDLAERVEMTSSDSSSSVRVISSPGLGGVSRGDPEASSSGASSGPPSLVDARVLRDLEVMKADHDLDTAVTEGSLAVIRGRYSIPAEYGLHVPQPGQRPYSSDAPGMCITKVLSCTNINRKLKFCTQNRLVWIRFVAYGIAAASITSIPWTSSAG